MILNIHQDAKKAMIEDALNAYPDECCGFFFGFDDGQNRTISSILVVNNSKQGDKRRRFEISPQDYLKAERYADDNNLQLLGVYHSHPDHPAIPSETDRKSAQPFFSYIIISIVGGKLNNLRSWQLSVDNDVGKDGHQFEEESIFKDLVKDA
ncbi:MAG TPA: M67 family metallopeptidase [Chitinophagaceae bacterium]|jgi:proteasome lid subunit RPN8/RPN11|nr:M67 family metallopeptidase [Chitinophagaceae bacterium]